MFIDCQEFSLIELLMPDGRSSQIPIRHLFPNQSTLSRLQFAKNFRIYSSYFAVFHKTTVTVAFTETKTTDFRLPYIR